ncbi:MAG TPA: hypothetical protein VNP72_04180 [Longimicrobium sp.]|nr:hypothetical protein [Longimicrobium sp.]
MAIREMEMEEVGGSLVDLIPAMDPGSEVVVLESGQPIARIVRILREDYECGTVRRIAAELDERDPAFGDVDDYH